MPPRVTSAGSEAVDLAKTAGLVLDDWQAWVLEEALGERVDHKWSAGRVVLIVPRQNGKGAVLEARALAGLLLFGERLITWSAHEFKTAQEAFLRMRALVEAPSIDLRVKRVLTGNGTETIEFIGGQRLRFLARSQSSGRGFTGDCTILDEAYELAPKAIAAMVPALSARPNPQVWFTSSAPMETSSVLHAVRNEGLTGTGDDRLAFFEWMVDDELADLNDREALAQANPGLGIRITEEFVETIERKTLTADDFRRERHGVPDPEPKFAGEDAIPADKWEACGVERLSRLVGVPAFGVDLFNKRATIAAGGVRGDGLEQVEIIDSDGDGPWLLPRLVDLVKANGATLYLDPSAEAGALVPDLVKAGVTPVPVVGRDKASACGRLLRIAVDGKLRHGNDSRLNAAVASAVQRRIGDAFVWDRRSKVSADLTPLYAVTLAAWPQQLEAPKSTLSF